jgi:hypothetical protein
VILYDPTGTIFRVVLAAAAAGFAWAAVAACLIHLGSTRLPPRLPRARIWADWRQKRMIWGISLLLTAVAAVFLGELLAQRLGMVDIYWMGRQPALLWIGRLAGACGYLLLLFVLVIAGVVRRRRPATPPPTRKPPRKPTSRA